MEISGLLFDMEDVFYDATMWRRWLLQLLGRFGLHTHYHAFFRVWEREYLVDVNLGRREYWEAMRCFLASAGLSRGQIDEVVAAGHARRRQLQETIRPLPGVVGTISRLSATGIPLGVLSNSWRTSQQLETMLARLGLARRFEVVLSSFEVGFAKPSPESYHAALSAMDMPPEDVAFVGNDTDELAGAADAGMYAVAVNYTPDAKADTYLDRLDQLFEVCQFRRARMLAG